MRTEHELPDIAFYYPNPIWRDGNWIKNLILFFDGIGLLVPEYMKDKIDEYDPAIVSGLRGHGLLHIIEPEKALDKPATEKLGIILTNLIVSGALDILAKDSSDFQHLSRSRLGYYSDEGLADMIFQELKTRGLAGESGDKLTVKLHPLVRTLILTLLSQITRQYGDKLKVNLNPVTDRDRLIGALSELLNIPSSPSFGNVISFDLNFVSVDLASIPIDEVLSFRKENINEFKNYQRECKSFVFELSRMSEEERKIKFELRQEHLNDLANDLRKRSKKAWKKPASFALSLAGATWTVVTGDIIGAAIATSSGVLGLDKNSKEVGAYSYLFKANNKWS